MIATVPALSGADALRSIRAVVVARKDPRATLFRVLANNLSADRLIDRGEFVSRLLGAAPD